MKRLLMVSLASCLIMASCGGDAAPPTSRSPTTATTAATTTATTTSMATTATTTAGGESLPPLLLADGEGIRLLAAGEPPVVFLEGTPASLAVPDLRGGVVFQGEPGEIRGLHFDETIGRNVYEWAGEGPAPIWLIRSPGHEPQLVVTHDDARLTLVDVVEIDGHPNILYRMMVGGPRGSDSWAQVLEWLCLYDLETGSTQRLGLVGSYESSVTQFRIGGSLVVTGLDPYGDDGGTQVRFIELGRLGRRVDYNWLPSLTSDRPLYGPATGCGTAPDCYPWAVVTAADDGSRIVWAQGWYQHADSVAANRPVELVALDPDSGTETMRLEIHDVPGGAEPVLPAQFIDDDGTNVVVSGVGLERDVVVVGSGGVSVLEAAGATASLWQAAMRTFTEPIAKETPLMLAGDGLGIVAFGTPTSEVLELLTVAIGPPSRELHGMYHTFDWDELNLTLLFSPADVYRTDGVEHLAGWSHWDAAVSHLGTSGGIGIGDTVAELLAAHGDRVVFPDGGDECLPTWIAWLNEPSAERRVLISFDGPAENGASRIGHMSAGAGYGC